MTHRIDWRRLLDAGWWHWLATLPLLAAHVALGPERARPCFEAAMLLCVAMAAYAKGHAAAAAPLSMAAQTRAAFAALLVLGLAPAAQWFHWLQLAGLASMVTVGYCPLERLLSLMPWNRRLPLTARLVRATFLTRPACGGILRPAPAGGADAAGDAPVSVDAPVCDDAGPCGLMVVR